MFGLHIFQAGTGWDGVGGRLPRLRWWLVRGHYSEGVLYIERVVKSWLT